MKFETLQILCYGSLVLALIIGTIILVWWYRKVAKRLNKRVENMRSVNNIGVMALIYNLPSLIVFILLFIPSIYFGGQLKQFRYCKDVIKVNSQGDRVFDFHDPEFIEDCGCFDLNELKEQ